MYDCPTRGASSPMSGRGTNPMRGAMTGGFLGGMNPAALIAGVIVLSGFMRR